MHRLVLFTFWLTLAISGQAALAEPDKTVTSFMNEPISLFDWGILKADEHLNQSVSAELGAYDARAGVRYDSSSNRIQIEVKGLLRAGSLNKQETLVTLNEVCRRFISVAKRHLQVDAETGKPTPGFGGHSSLGSNFRHPAGFTDSFMGVERWEGLDRISVVEGCAVDRDSAIAVVCTSTLLSPTVAYSERSSCVQP
jgi:hypothetical protein